MRTSPGARHRRSLRTRSLRTGSLRTGSLRTGSLRTGSLRTGSLRTGSLLVALLTLVIHGPVQAAELTDEQRRLFSRPGHTVFPASAPYSPQVATLGKMLFFDQRLSREHTTSCSSCHNPSFGWETPAVKPIGAGNVPLSRHAPTIINLADTPSLFWDGRVASLEEQAMLPLSNPLEMDMPMSLLVTRLQGIDGYARWFDTLFPGEGVSARTILTSIATFERTLVSGWSDFDDWVAGDEAAISAQAKRGFELFTGRARCVACHSGWSFTDHRFHDIGLDTSDPGRERIEPDGGRNLHAFKTPTLRNIGLRAPYMHDGATPTLAAVLSHYESGGIARDSRSPLLGALSLQDDERDALIAFLHTLSEQRLDVSTPVLPAQ